MVLVIFTMTSKPPGICVVEDDPVLTEHGIPLSNDDDTLPLDDPRY